ncbi:MAG: SRPBCC domain-containing protein [Candidatus Sericytochromatia bacterium]
MGSPETFRIQETIARPLVDVFAALTQPGELEQFFLTSASASPLDAREISWWLSEHEVLHLQLAALRSEQMLEFRLRLPELGDPITLRFELTDQGKHTTLAISESGWPDGPLARQQSYLHCQLWQRLGLSLKAWLEHGIDLR